MTNWRAASRERHNRAGFTLLEVVVVMALLGLILGVSAVALASLGEPPDRMMTGLLVAARDSAIRTGTSISIRVTLPDTSENRAPRSTYFLFLPDGRGVGFGVDPLTGDPLAHR